MSATREADHEDSHGHGVILARLTTVERDVSRLDARVASLEGWKFEAYAAIGQIKVRLGFVMFLVGSIGGLVGAIIGAVVSTMIRR